MDLEWDRPLCWISENLLGVGFNKTIERENGKNFQSEIIFYDISEDKIVHRFNFDGFALTSEGEVKDNLYFDSKNKQFIAIDKETGILISDINGKEIYKDSNLTSHKYSRKHEFIYRMDCTNQLMEIIEIE